MKKILKTIFVVFSVSFFAQSREELNKAMLSNNQTEISEFIQKYPKNPNVPFLKKKMGMAKNSNSPSVNQNADPINKEKVVKQIDKFVEKKEQTGKTQKTENLINHLFSNDPSKKEAFVAIKNKSSCDIVVRLEGTNKNFYNLDIPKQSDNSILITKGNYNISTNICGVKYATVKKITEDIQINLNIQKAKK